MPPVRNQQLLQIYPVVQRPRVLEKINPYENRVKQTLPQIDFLAILKYIDRFLHLILQINFKTRICRPRKINNFHAQNLPQNT